MNHSGAFTVFGGATVDHAAATCAAPVMHASNPGVSRTAPGGVGLNIARVLARLGREVRIVSRIGDDADGAAVLGAARGDGIDTGWIAVAPEERTASYRAAFGNDGELIIGIADMAILDAVTPEVVAPAIAAARPGEPFVLDANLPAQTLAVIANAAVQTGRSLAAVGVSPAKAVRLAPLLDRITCLFATRREAAAILDRADDPQVATGDLALAIAGRGAAHVVVTDSGSPLAAATGAEVRLFPPLPARVASVNGAGDSLTAGLLHGLAGGRSFFDAVPFGLGAAAITVEDTATVAAGISAQAVLDRLARARVAT